MKRIVARILCVDDGALNLSLLEAMLVPVAMRCCLSPMVLKHWRKSGLNGLISVYWM